MTTVRPRLTAHRGTVVAGGFLLDAELLGEEEARRRVLALWSPGDGVYRIGPLFALRLGAPRQVSCSMAPGLPLVSSRGILMSAPLTADELDALALPHGSLALVRGGVAEAMVLGAECEVSVGSWLDLSGLEVEEGRALGDLCTVPEVAIPAAVTDVRAALGGSIPPPSEEVAKVLESLRSRAEPTATQAGSQQPGLGTRFLAWLAGKLNPRGGATPTSAPQTTALATVPRSGGLRAWFSRALERILMRTQLLSVLERQHAAYFERMLDMFENGDFESALRHAIPLGGSEAAELAFGVPQPRDSLTLGQRPERITQMLGSARIDARLRETYLNAFRRLEREGRIEEAAYVLAELLNDSDRAVEYLEQHGRLRMAAELAEARRLPIGRIIRQWFLAKETERAIALARLHGAFAEALSWLEIKKTDPAVIKGLRLLWADTLAKAGKFAEAVAVIREVPEGLGLADAWIDRALKLGGAAEARALPLKLELHPEAFPEVRDRVLELCEPEADDGAVARTALGEALMAGAAHAQKAMQPEAAVSKSVTLARAVGRALVQDARGLDGETARLAKRVIKFSGDGPLQTDLPSFQPRKGVPPTAFDLWLRPGDVGTLPIRDGAALPRGRALARRGRSEAVGRRREGGRALRRPGAAPGDLGYRCLGSRAGPARGTLARVSP